MHSLTTPPSFKNQKISVTFIFIENNHYSILWRRNCRRLLTTKQCKNHCKKKDLFTVAKINATRQQTVQKHPPKRDELGKRTIFCFSSWQLKRHTIICKHIGKTFHKKKKRLFKINILKELRMTVAERKIWIRSLDSTSTFCNCIRRIRW